MSVVINLVDFAAQRIEHHGSAIAERIDRRHLPIVSVEYGGRRLAQRVSGGNRPAIYETSRVPFSLSRLNDRRGLLSTLDAHQEQLASLAAARQLSDQQQLAFSILGSGRIARAFAIDEEAAAVRDHYGRHSFGQSLLLARRLVQAGVPVVQANMGRAQTWDSHGDIFRRLSRDLLPPLDQGVAALLEDLDATGLLDETLVVMLGEFGRTPRLSGPGAPGRDHWAPCFFALFAGAGVRGGQVIGRSDAIGAYPATPPYTPDDLGATVYHVLGVDPASEVRDRQARPVTLNRGEVMQALFTG